jgi:hypothetical protein
MKTEVYSWRVSTETKMALEHEARRRNVSLAALLETAAQEWLKRVNASTDDDERQRELRQTAERHFGVIAGSNPNRSTQVRELVRARLRQKHGR